MLAILGAQQLLLFKEKKDKMTTADFLLKIQDELMEENPITLETNFKELKGYDSMANLALMVFADDNFGVNIDPKELKEITTVQQLKETIGVEHFED